jgi:hypothetical protein
LRHRKEVHIKTVNVKYQVATYSGVISVRVSDDDDNATIVAKAKAKLRRQAGGTLPFGYQHFKIQS